MFPLREPDSPESPAADFPPPGLMVPVSHRSFLYLLKERGAWIRVLMRTALGLSWLSDWRLLGEGRTIDQRAGI
jgi:hypothetical protein